MSNLFSESFQLTSPAENAAEKGGSQIIFCQITELNLLTNWGAEPVGKTEEGVPLPVSQSH